MVTKSVVLSDGTYATQVAMVPSNDPRVGNRGGEEKVTPLRAALLAGDVFLGGLLVSSLTKLTVHALETAGKRRKRRKSQPTHPPTHPISPPTYV